ncbi:flagellar assembly protein FliH [Tepidibacillus fermentans]|uniref:Flagellar assembly protein FliH n=1 Tax=Tepidibacillus fermentans TaxID=1281767 RepID=A0A4R3KHJ0_9BACI|nr:flagellar assembly protein FliH [Tepidibacillus fermentans]TCS82937.1 flagellar assembly protein FliH [Tepidibacillus fermentans]
MSRIFKSVQHEDVKEVKTIAHTFTVSQQDNDRRFVATDYSKRDEFEASQSTQIIQDAEETAVKIIEQAKQDAEQLKLDAKNEIQSWWEQEKVELQHKEEEAEKRGFQTGFEEGFQNGLQKASSEYQEQIQQANQILQEAYSLKEQIIQEAEPTIIELAVTIAKKIVMKEVEIDPDIVKKIAREALRNSKEFEKVIINVDPHYFAYLQSAREELMMELNGNVDLSIFPDSSIQDAGIVVKTSYGALDARVDTQLEELKQILLDVLNRRVL